MNTPRYVHALRFPSLTRFYDPVLRATLREEELKRRLVHQVALAPGMRVLDLGCGTGTLTTMLALAEPGAEIVGLDGDPATLARARQKLEAAGARADLREGLATEPPFSPASFDRVVSSLVLHHLTLADKRRALGKARGLLRPGGEIHILDWGKAQDPLMRLLFLGVQALDGFATTRDNVAGRLPELLGEAGFEDVCEVHRARTVFGTLSFYRGRAR